MGLIRLVRDYISPRDAKVQTDLQRALKLRRSVELSRRIIHDSQVGRLIRSSQSYEQQFSR